MAEISGITRKLKGKLKKKAYIFDLILDPFFASPNPVEEGTFLRPY